MGSRVVISAGSCSFREAPVLGVFFRRHSRISLSRDARAGMWSVSSFVNSIVTGWMVCRFAGNGRFKCAAFAARASSEAFAFCFCFSSSVFLSTVTRSDSVSSASSRTNIASSALSFISQSTGLGSTKTEPSPSAACTASGVRIASANSRSRAFRVPFSFAARAVTSSSLSYSTSSSELFPPLAARLSPSSCHKRNRARSSAISASFRRSMVTRFVRSSSHCFSRYALSVRSFFLSSARFSATTLACACSTDARLRSVSKSRSSTALAKLPPATSRRKRPHVIPGSALGHRK
mmetsp:Transcript_1782/g.6744  ORF Transcript_1782/g.6744 Transcript_1782/m.6744 type:complete len:292 (+) Transcript_1782:1016-1891(+)